MPPKKKVQYTVTPIDVDGDNKIDGDLVTQYINGKVASQKFVPLAKMKTALKKAAKKATTPKKATKKPTTKAPTRTATRKREAAAPVYAEDPPPQRQTVYSNIPQDIQQSNNTVMVSDQTGFGQYIKQGAGLEAGRLATNAVVDTVSSFFSSEE